MPDFQKVFETSPDAYLVLDADPTFTIAAVNDAYLRATMTTREQIVGRPIFEVFPDNPEQPHGVSVKTLRASLETVVATRQRHEFPPLQYDIPRSAAQGGGFEQRFWRTSNIPVLGADGSVRQIIHRVEDITALVRLQQTERDHQRDNEALLARAAAARAEVESRNEELAQTHRDLAEHRQLLHEARVRLEAAVSAGDIATFIWELGTDSIHADQNLRAWFRLPADAPAKAALSHYRAAFHPDDLPKVQHVVARIRAGEAPAGIEFRLRNGDS
ncbi:MAG TPA: PAS domain-containing protein, partial [Opitutus sp.]|nr:PAS domain-containing protein [Opitutus sp.]